MSYNNATTTYTAAPPKGRMAFTMEESCMCVFVTRVQEDLASFFSVFYACALP